MIRTVLRCLPLLVVPLPALADAKAEPIDFYFVDSGTAPGPAVLWLSVQSTAHYSCANYRLPVTAKVSGQTISVQIGPVAKPDGGLCATAMGPARGEATVGKLPAGLYRLQITQGRAVDSYTLTIGEETTGLAPQQGRFSTSSSQIVYRVAEQAAHVSCVFGLDARCRGRAQAGAPTCESFFSDPALAELKPLPPRPGPYSQSWFNSDGRRYAAPAFSVLRPLVLGARYRDPERCLVLTVHAGGGESVSNLR